MQQQLENNRKINKNKSYFKKTNKNDTSLYRLRKQERRLK